MLQAEFRLLVFKRFENALCVHMSSPIPFSKLCYF